MKGPKPSQILLIDINAAWVRSLMEALPGVTQGGMRLHAWQVYGSSYWLANRDRISKPKAGQNGLAEQVVVVPGWNRFGRLSTALLNWKVRRFARRFGWPEVIIHTLPQYAGVAAKFTNCFQVYYAYDAYRFYGGGWDPVHIGHLENQMLNACDMAFAISRQLQHDFQQLTTKPVFYSPNAVSSAFISQLASSCTETPPEFRGWPGKTVGCVGQISESGYDWPLIESLANALPEFTFVFIGPMADNPSGSRARVERVLGLPNVRWLGPRPHAELGRYFASFDICLGPYALTPLNHRRSALRMYDYLCTSKPILFTPISEVCHHRAYLEVGDTGEECMRLIRRMASSDYRVDLAARRRFVEANTWEMRAASLWNTIIDGRAEDRTKTTVSTSSPHYVAHESVG